MAEKGKPIENAQVLVEKQGELTAPPKKSLDKVRNEVEAKLREEIAKGTYRSLGGLILDKTDEYIDILSERITRKPIAKDNEVGSWKSGFEMFIGTLLIGLLVSLILGERIPLNEVMLCLWGAAIGSVIMVANKITIQMFLKTFQGKTLSSIESPADIKNLKKWLDDNFDLRRPLIWGLLIGPLLGGGFLLIWMRNHGQVVHIGTWIIAILAGFQSALVTYYIYPFYVVLPARLSQYRFKLFTADPSGSQVVDELSDLFTAVMYITVIYCAVIVLSLAYFGLINMATSLYMALMVWIPAIALFAGSQVNLSKVISRSKWDALQVIQDRVEELQAEILRISKDEPSKDHQENLNKSKDEPSKDRLEYLDKLMDYHDRVKNTQNSALNFRARLNFFNSLIIPLIAFLLSNWGEVVKVFDAVRANLKTP